MMIHEKILSGQFLMDFKNDHSSILHTRHPHHHLHLHGHQQPLVPHISPSPLDIYSAYNLQQQFLGGGLHQPQHQSKACESATATEVLDLSRRYDSTEIPRKTPSPYQSTSSMGNDSPTSSPNGHRQPQIPHQIPTNLLYASQRGHHAPSLHPVLHYTNLKQEPISPPPVVTTTTINATVGPASIPEMPAAVPTPKSPISKMASPISASTPSSGSRTPILPMAASSALQDTKTTRPFKAFPRDPLVIAATFAATDVLLDNPQVERYTEYRKRVLEQIRTSNGGARTVTNPKMRRLNSRNGSVHDGSSSNHNSESDERNAAEESSDCDSNAGNFEKLAADPNAPVQDANSSSNNASQVKDAAYYERRRKNNAAAKKSRDRRRIKEDEIAIRAAYLERQNIELLCQIDALKAQLAALVSKNGP